MSPFDPKTVLLAKHAQHVVLIHFPIALFLVGVVFDFAARWTKASQIAAAAYYNIILAAAATVPTLITGILAWQFALEGQKLKGLLLLHLVLGGATSMLIWIVAILHFRARRASADVTNYCLALEACTAAALMVTAHLGGFLSGVNS